MESQPLTSYTVFDSARTTTQADDQRVVLLKGALLSELVQQPRVLKVFARWAKQTGLLNQAEQIANAGDRLAKALRLPDRSMLNSSPTPAIKGKRLSRLASQHKAAIAPLRDPERLRALTRHHAPEAAQVARDLGMSYPWVVQGLLHGFIACLFAIAAGQEIVLPLPKIVLTLDPSATRPKGYKPDPAVIARYARWYVLKRISGVSINALARDYHQSHVAKHADSVKGHSWENDRKFISDGIAEVERILSLML